MSDLDQVRKSLQMVGRPDPDRLLVERELLQSLEGKPPLARIAGYLKLSGPGYLQSAMTLGGGTAAAALQAGVVFGYQLLWVGPMAMLIGVLVLAAVAHQTLSTGERPFDAMRRHAGAPFAYMWAIGALIASIIWHFPQYALASAVMVDMGSVAGLSLDSMAMGGLVLVWALALSTMYGTSAKLVRAYERVLKYTVWFMVLCFGAVVVKTGIDDWGALFRGFFGFAIPGQKHNIDGLTVALGGMAAAVGINMVFLYPYSLLARGWGREHRRLARFDLGMGMFVPYVIATSLVVIAAANTIHLDAGFDAKALSPAKAGLAFEPIIGVTFARIVFNLGILAMALSTITLHMICSGFVCTELFGWQVGTWKYRLGTWIPVPGVLGSVYWSGVPLYVPVVTSILCGFLLPLIYLAFILLQGNARYLGADLPQGWKASLWRGAMIVGTLVLTVALAWYVKEKVFS